MNHEDRVLHYLYQNRPPHASFINCVLINMYNHAVISVVLQVFVITFFLAALLEMCSLLETLMTVIMSI